MRGHNRGRCRARARCCRCRRRPDGNDRLRRCGGARRIRACGGGGRRWLLAARHHDGCRLGVSSAVASVIALGVRLQLRWPVHGRRRPAFGVV